MTINFCITKILELFTKTLVFEDAVMGTFNYCS